MPRNKRRRVSGERASAGKRGNDEFETKFRTDPGLVRALGTLGLLVVTAGIAPALWAQNAAQRTALAKLGAPRANVLSNNTQVNGVEATAVSLDRPLGVAYDAAGNFYIADTDNFVIREVNLAGITTVVAGTGEQGFGGDGGPATSALLDSPEGIALDAAGNPTSPTPGIIAFVR